MAPVLPLTPVCFKVAFGRVLHTKSRFVLGVFKLGTIWKFASKKIIDRSEPEKGNSLSNPASRREQFPHGQEQFLIRKL